MKRLAFCAGLLAVVVVAGSAQAQSRIAYTVANANLRAGPDSGYPRVATLPAGVPLDIYGCVDDWSWCDVQWRGERGWISAGLLEYDDSGRRVEVYGSGAEIGLPILAFALGTYWSDHYRQRTWYRERDRWGGYHPPARPPIRPAQPRPQARPIPQSPRPPAGNDRRPSQQRPFPGNPQPGQPSRPDHAQRPPQPAPRPAQNARPSNPVPARPSQPPAARPDDRQGGRPEQRKQDAARRDRKPPEDHPA